MPLYEAYGSVIDSMIALPELAQPDGARLGHDFRFSTAPAGNRTEDQWLRHYPSRNGAAWLSFGRCGADFLVRFHRLADFLLADGGREIVAYAVPSTPPETVRHLFLDQVLPLALSHQGQVALHASAVVVGGRAVAFVGESGKGKSTLAASLATQGHPLLADDCLVLKWREGLLVGMPG